MSTSITRLPHVFPDRMDGLTVLDVGGYEGNASQMCLDRGAASAIVVDSEQWTQYGWNAPDRRPGPTFLKADILEYHEPADVVVASNVLYHQENPWLFLAHLRKLAKQFLLLHTWINDGDQFYWQIYKPLEGHSRSATVVWRPMAPALVKLLENVGFTEVRQLHREGEHITLHCT